MSLVSGIANGVFTPYSLLLELGILFGPVATDTTKLSAHLRAAFSRDELTFLNGHPRFARMLKEFEGSEAGLAALVKEGGALIQKHYGGKAALFRGAAEKFERLLRVLAPSQRNLCFPFGK